MLEFLQNQLASHHSAFIAEKKNLIESINQLVKIANFLQTNGISNILNEQSAANEIKTLYSLQELMIKLNSDVDAFVDQLDPSIIDAIDASSLLLPDMPKADLSVYRVGDESECVVTHVKDAVIGLCHIIDVNQVSSLVLNKEITMELFGVPEPGFIFAVRMRGTLYRATRTYSKPSQSSYRIMLVDIGDTITTKIVRKGDKPDKFCLSKRAQDLRPMAIMCVVEKLDNQTGATFKNMFSRKRYRFKVVRVNLNSLAIELFSDSVQMTEAIAECKNKKKKFRDLNAMEQLSIANEPASESSPAGREKIQPFEKVETNPFRVEADNCNKQKEKEPAPDPISSADISHKNSANLNPKISLLSALNRRLFRAQYDSLKKTQDESAKKSECPYATTSQCSQGAHPRAYTSSNTGVPNFELQLPTVGSQTYIYITHILSPNEFFGILGPYYLSLHKLQYDLNGRQNCATLKQLSATPKIHDLVLARYSLNREIHRAQVQRVTLDDQIIIVYVDFGDVETVDIAQLYEWPTTDDLCNSLPFQAVHFNWHNPEEKLSSETLFNLSQQMLRKPSSVEIIEILNRTLVVAATDVDPGNPEEQYMFNNSS